MHNTTELIGVLTDGAAISLEMQHYLRAALSEEGELIATKGEEMRLTLRCHV